MVIALTPFKAAGGAASEARESSTGALAGVCADRVVAVGRTLDSWGERRQGGCGRQSPALSYKAHAQVYTPLQLPYCTGREEVEGTGEMRNPRQSVRPGKWKCYGRWERTEEGWAWPWRTSQKTGIERSTGRWHGEAHEEAEDGRAWTSRLSGWAGEVRQKMQIHWEALTGFTWDGKAESLGELGGAHRGLE